MEEHLVLFDIDGTILRYKKSLSKQFISEVLSEIFEKDVPANIMPSFSGMTDLQILSEICELVGIAQNALYDNIDLIWSKLFDRFQKFCTTDNIELLKGAAHILNLLAIEKKIRLGLLTGNFKENAYLKLGLFSLSELFPFGAFGSDRQSRNMLPPIAIERANMFVGKKLFSTANTLIIGDSPRDIECARTNGIPVCCVSTGNFSSIELKKYSPDLLFESFENHESVFKKLTEFLNKY